MMLSMNTRSAVNLATMTHTPSLTSMCCFANEDNIQALFLLELKFAGNYESKFPEQQENESLGGQNELRVDRAVNT